MASIEGRVGSIRWVYQAAATLDGYRVSYRKGPPAVWTLEGTVGTWNNFALTQRPLVFEAPYTGGVWRWPVEAITITDRHVTARLGAPEKG